MEILEWITQVKRGILEYSILSLMAESELYGYELITKLNNWEILSTKEGTIYPLLKRLEKDDLIKSEWRESEGEGPPRKYYSLTAEGKKMLNQMDIEWNNLKIAINDIKGGEVEWAIE